MNYSNDAAEQVVRMSLNGVEIGAKLTGKATERLAILLYSVLKQQKKTKGKVRLVNMLKNGKTLKVFAIKDEELQKFCAEAKRYGVLYCVLKDRDANDGLTDIMVRDIDASKINRIFQRYGLSRIEIGDIRPEIAEGKSAPVQARIVEDKVKEYIDQVVKLPEEKPERIDANPTVARTEGKNLSGPLSASREKQDGASDVGRIGSNRKSVRLELREIAAEQKAKEGGIPVPVPEPGKVKPGGR